MTETKLNRYNKNNIEAKSSRNKNKETKEIWLSEKDINADKQGSNFPGCSGTWEENHIDLIVSSICTDCVHEDCIPCT